MTKRLFFAAIMGVFATALAACSPGYMKASELESKHQGPADCQARCVELGMRMGALVLVSDTLPGCVCQPAPAAGPPVPAPPAAAPPAAAPPAPAPNPPPALPGGPPANPGPAAPISDASQQGASAATASYVVATMAAAAAARANQTEQQRRTQQSYVPK